MVQAEKIVDNSKKIVDNCKQLSKGGTGGTGLLQFIHITPKKFLPKILENHLSPCEKLSDFEKVCNNCKNFLTFY